VVDRVDTERPAALDEHEAAVRLNAERDRLAERIAELEGLESETEADSIGEVAAAGQHPADVGTETFERERESTLLGELRSERVEIDEALARLAANTYGRCVTCRRSIDPRRLVALPATRLCIRCEERYELGGTMVGELAHPAHGTVADTEEFLPDNDLPPAAVEAPAGPEEGAVFTHGDEELSTVELTDELAAEGALEDEVGPGGVDVDEEAVEERLEQQETEETGAAGEEQAAEEELVEAGGEEEEEEELEADLTVAIRRQLGLEEEDEEEEEVEAPAEEFEALPRPRQPDEFLCSSCYQLKRRTQLADPVGRRCVDCVTNSAA
jgi:RNA polymerase-binding transcription factor DksA